MNGGKPVLSKKRQPDGFAERRKLLARHGFKWKPEASVRCRPRRRARCHGRLPHGDADRRRHGDAPRAGARARPLRPADEHLVLSYSGLMPAACSTGTQIGSWTFSQSPSCCGVPPMATKPRLRRSSLRLRRRHRGVQRLVQLGDDRGRRAGRRQQRVDDGAVDIARAQFLEGRDGRRHRRRARATPWRRA